jgi:hypothetical protein
MKHDVIRLKLMTLGPQGRYFINRMLPAIAARQFHVRVFHGKRIFFAVRKLSFTFAPIFEYKLMSVTRKYNSLCRTVCLTGRKKKSLSHFETDIINIVINHLKKEES